MSSFIDRCRELIALLGPLRVKRMFSGHAFYLEGVVVAYVVRDVLYLKTDALTAARFSERGLEPFSFERNGKRVALSYHTAPEEVLEDEEAAREWIGEALAAARRAAAGKG